MSTSRRKNSEETLKFLEKQMGGPLSLGGLLEAIRLGEEQTQNEFARSLGISRSHLNDIEKGRKSVSPGRAARFARHLGYSEEQFTRLSLQSILDDEGIDWVVSLEPRKSRVR
jgi:transcriptional regulator with XRE-family HTH domain